MIALRAALIAIVAFATVSAAGARADDGRYLPRNTWVKLQTVATTRFLPRNFIDCTQTFIRSNPAGRRASGFTYGDAGIFYWGGAGPGYNGNDVEIFDVGANTWVQQYQPECLPTCCRTSPACEPGCLPANGNGTTTLTPLGRPYPEHLVQLAAYHALRKKYVAALTPGLWEWDPQTTEWTQLTPERPASADLSTKVLMYDPVLETVLYFATTNNSPTVFRFDYEAMAWVDHSSIPRALMGRGIFAAYDSVEHKFLISHGSGTVWIYDSMTGTWTQVMNAPAEIVGLPGWTQWLSYDPLSGLFLLANQDASTVFQLWTYRIATGEWTRVTPAGTAPRGPTDRGYNGLVYDDNWKRFYAINTHSVGAGGQGGDCEGCVETWTYRIGGPSGPGDANCDETVTAADVTGVIQSLASDPLAGCGVTDASHDGTINDLDVALTVAALFRLPQ